MAYNDLVHLSNSVYDFLVTLRESLEVGGNNDSLVIDQLITLAIGKGIRIIGLGIPPNLIGFYDLGLAGFPQRSCDFV